MRRTLLLTLLALLVTTGSAVAATTVKPNYVYAGRTTQGIAVHLAAQVKGARWFRYQAKMACNDGSTFTDDYFSDDVSVAHDRFSVRYTSNAGAVTTHVQGVLSGKQARGTIRIVERFSQVAVNGNTPLSATGSIVCDSGTVRWTATA
jgi:hypothetical protein